MPAPSPETLLIDLVSSWPPRVHVLERIGVDCRRGAGRTLADACRERGLDPETVARILDAPAETTSPQDRPGWLTVSLPDLIDHIRTTHHDYLRRALPDLSQRLEMAVKGGQDDLPRWVSRVRDTVQNLRDDLMGQLRREEEYLFPALRTVAKGRVLPGTSTSPSEPLREMARKQEAVRTALDRLRRLTDSYRPPSRAGRKVREAMAQLHELEVDMRCHLYEELQILFPRVRSLFAGDSSPEPRSSA
jgi:regulator of cell morphogenesis and NO signaling